MRHLSVRDRIREKQHCKRSEAEGKATYPQPGQNVGRLSGRKICFHFESARVDERRLLFIFSAHARAISVSSVVCHSDSAIGLVWTKAFTSNLTSEGSA